MLQLAVFLALNPNMILIFLYQAQFFGKIRILGKISILRTLIEIELTNRSGDYFPNQ